ncbi:MAG: tetratricopeptide repeat protein [Ktedonobacterales bacterium]
MLVSARHNTPPPTSTAAPAGARGRSHTRGRAWLRVARLVAIYALTLTGLAAALGPIGPSIDDDLAAAKTASAALRYDRALADYAAASAADAADPRPFCGAGDVYMTQQLYPNAATAYGRCAALAPHDASAQLRLGDALNATGNTSAARGAWSAAVALGSLDAHRRLALLDERQFQMDAARREWNVLPYNDPQAREHLGFLALWNGDDTTARLDFLAVRATPNPYAQQITDDGFVVYAALPVTSATGLGLLGYDFIRAGLPGFAIRPLRAAVALDPAFGDAHAYLGWALWQTGETAAARPEIALGTRLNPKLSFAWFAAGEVAVADGKTQAALADFTTGVDHDIKNPVLWLAVAQTSLALYDYVPADIAFDNAARLSTDPSYTVALLRFYVDHAFGIARDRAQIAASLALQRFPQSEPVRYYIAAVFDLYGYPTLAYATAQAARALDPTDPAPYVLLARYDEADGDYVAAALELRTALALRPNGPFAAQARRLLAPIADISV